ncbi:MAG: hypothetical protein EBT67_12525 [Betaproteobacteria bacterium]|nr:hypothetical protein [Betaproteobacteria bacterium]
MFFFSILILILYSFSAKSLSNNVIVTIDNIIITELDFKKELDFIKFINKEEIDTNSAKIKKEIIESLIDRKIKKIEVDNAKIEINEKEIENYLYNYFISNKINDEMLNDFYKKYQLENDYLKNIISIDSRWIKMIRQIYESRINVNLTEVNEEIKKKNLSVEDSEKLRNQIISSEKNKILNKFSATHLEKSKRKYLIKFL